MGHWLQRLGQPGRGRVVEVSLEQLQAENRTIETPHGPALGTSYRWPGGQYCAIHTPHGLVGCGIYDVHTAGEFGIAIAIARGTPAKPLVVPEDLFDAKIVDLSEPARRLGICEGMTGLEAVGKLLAAGDPAHSPARGQAEGTG